MESKSSLLQSTNQLVTQVKQLATNNVEGTVQHEVIHLR